jgi:hypothetical protein
MLHGVLLLQMLLGPAGSVDKSKRPIGRNQLLVLRCVRTVPASTRRADLGRHLVLGA